MSDAPWTSIGLGDGHTAIVHRPIRDVTEAVEVALRARQFFGVEDVRDGQTLWINPLAVTVLQEVFREENDMEYERKGKQDLQAEADRLQREVARLEGREHKLTHELREARRSLRFLEKGRND